MTTGEKAPLPRAWTTPAEAKDEHSDKEPEVAHDFDGNVKVSQKPPKPQDLERVASLPVLNSSNVSIPFRNLHTSTDGSPRRFLVIFIRHFFCGVCR